MPTLRHAHFNVVGTLALHQNTVLSLVCYFGSTGGDNCFLPRIAEEHAPVLLTS